MSDFEQHPIGTATTLERMHDALDHIMRVARQAGTITKRLKMIELRAKSALEGTDEWRDYDYPRNRQHQQENLRARLRVSESSRKADCVEFFRWFWNAPGTNAEQGYDDWLAEKESGS